MHYINLSTRKVFKDCYGYWFFVGSFDSPEDLQELLNRISCFSGFAKPGKYISVIKKFEKETKEKVFY